MRNLLLSSCFSFSISILLAQANLQWQEQTSNTTESLQEVQFIDNDIGFVIGKGTFLRTVNGGASWSTSGISTTSLYDMHFIDANTGYVVGDWGKCLKTIDGGNNWVDVSPPGHTTFYRLNGVFFTDQNNGVVVGSSGTIYKTEDGGMTWTDKSRGSEVLMDVKFRNSQYGVVIGSRSTIYKTLDGGNTWSRVIVKDAYIDLPLSIRFLNSTIGFISGNGGLLKTADGGDSWSKVNAPTSSVRDIFFTDELTGYALGSGSTCNRYYTINGGQSWTYFDVPNYRSGGSSIFFSSYDIGYMVCSGGQIYKYGLSDSIHQEEIEKFTVYPNPANQSFSIHNLKPKNYSLTIFNTEGKVVYENDFNSGYTNNNVKVENLSTGVYIIQLNGTDFTFNKKLLVEH